METSIFFIIHRRIHKFLHTFDLIYSFFVKNSSLQLSIACNFLTKYAVPCGFLLNR